MIEVKILHERPIKVDLFGQSHIDVGVLPYQIMERNIIEEYSGTYEINPSFEKQNLETKEKRMKNNLTVNPIMVSRTSNQTGGNTIYIGGIING